MAIVVALAAALFAGYMLFTLLFKDWDELNRCLLFWIIPERRTFFLGRLREDLWSEFKLLLWVAGVLSMGFSAYRAFA